MNTSHANATTSRRSPPSHRTDPVATAPRRTPQPSVIPLRLPPAPKNKAERARADALATFHRGHLDELVAHYGLPINRVVQLALRHLHRQVCPQSYPHDDSSAADLATEAASGLAPLTAAQASAVLANSGIRGAELGKQLGLGKGEKILTLADFFDRASAELDAADTAAAASKGRASKAASSERSRQSAKAPQRPAKASAKARGGKTTSARIARA